jgi:hypothetical protein
MEQTELMAQTDPMDSYEYMAMVAKERSTQLGIWTFMQPFQLLANFSLLILGSMLGIRSLSLQAQSCEQLGQLQLMVRCESSRATGEELSIHSMEAS